MDNEKDKLEDLFKRRFENEELPIPQGMWDRVRPTLPPPPPLASQSSDTNASGASTPWIKLVSYFLVATFLTGVAYYLVTKPKGNITADKTATVQLEKTTEQNGKQNQSDISDENLQAYSSSEKNDLEKNAESKNAADSFLTQQQKVLRTISSANENLANNTSGTLDNSNSNSQTGNSNIANTSKENNQAKNSNSKKFNSGPKNTNSSSLKKGSNLNQEEKTKNISAQNSSNNTSGNTQIVSSSNSSNNKKNSDKVKTNKSLSTLQENGVANPNLISSNNNSTKTSESKSVPTNTSSDVNSNTANNITANTKTTDESGKGNDSDLNQTNEKVNTDKNSTTNTSGSELSVADNNETSQNTSSTNTNLSNSTNQNSSSTNNNSSASSDSKSLNTLNNQDSTESRNETVSASIQDTTNTNVAKTPDGIATAKADSAVTPDSILAVKPEETKKTDSSATKKEKAKQWRGNWIVEVSGGPSLFQKDNTSRTNTSGLSFAPNASAPGVAFQLDVFRKLKNNFMVGVGLSYQRNSYHYSASQSRNENYTYNKDTSFYNYFQYTDSLGIHNDSTFIDTFNVVNGVRTLENTAKHSIVSQRWQVPLQISYQWRSGRVGMYTSLNVLFTYYKFSGSLNQTGTDSSAVEAPAIPSNKMTVGFGGTYGLRYFFNQHLFLSGRVTYQSNFNIAMPKSTLSIQGGVGYEF